MSEAWLALALVTGELTGRGSVQSTEGDNLEEAQLLGSAETELKGASFGHLW